MESVKICEYCECKFYNKNKVFCSRDCQIEHMRLRPCQSCGQLKIKEEGVHYCTEECREKMAKHMLKSNLETCLGYGFMNGNRHELIDFSFSIKNHETQKTETHTINFKEWI